MKGKCTMNKRSFIEEITTKFTDLYVEIFTLKYFENFDGNTFEKDFENSLTILDKKMIKKFKRKIDKIKVVHYE